MTNIGSNELDSTIAKLNKLLFDGYNKQKNCRNHYLKNKDGEGFDKTQYINEVREILNAWFKQVYVCIDANINEGHYLFHFIQHKGSSMSLLGFPEELSNLLISFEYYLYALEDVILKLEERRNLAVRQEIAEKEYKADVIYEITYSDHTREVKINNILLAKTDFNSENDNCFQYIYKNPGRPITKDELENAIGTKLKKRLVQIVSDLGFTQELRQVFFPATTKTEIMFVNPITEQYAHKHKLPALNFKKICRQSMPE